MAEKVITFKQQKAIAALLSERTARDAARKAGVSEKTLYSWLAGQDFRAALRSAESELMDTVTRRLNAGQVKALETLEDLIENGQSETTRLNACLAWLNIFVKYRDIRDIDERLTALENKQNANQ